MEEQSPRSSMIAQKIVRTGFHNAGSINLAFLWATAANTVPGLFFTIYYIIRFREAYEAVCNEMKEFSHRRPNWLHCLNRAALDELVVLDSVVREVLRLISSAMILREAKNDFTFTTADGRDYDIRKGERLTITSTALHLDERIYPNPRSFMYNRFMKSDDPDVQNQRIRSLFEGKPLLMQNIFLPFGSGSHLCPGRHLALIEIKQFVLFLLNDFDVELVDPSASIPKFDHSRYGLGNLPPALLPRW